MASLAEASAICRAVLSCVACSPTTASSVEAPESTSIAEGPGASWAWELVGAEEGLKAGVAGVMAGEESRCSISLIFLEAPRVLEDFLRLGVAFFLKCAKCISTGIRQINETMSENKKLTQGGALWQTSRWLSSFPPPGRQYSFWRLHPPSSVSCSRRQ